MVGSPKSGLLPDRFSGVPIVFVPASTIKNRSVSWAIDHHIPIGDLALFAGPQKSGKSLTIAHLIACVTNNVAFAPGLFVNKEAQGHALLYSGERATDSFASPRCAAAGADMSKVYIRDRIYSLDDVIMDIAKAPRTVRLIGIDPLKAYVDVAHMSDKKARQLLDTLADIARERHAAVVIMHHVTLRGRRSDDPTDYIQGRRVLVEAPLCSWMQCGLGNGFILQQVASNKLAGQRYEYQIVSHTLPDGTETERLEMLGVSKHHIIDALNGQARLMAVKTKRDRALEWLGEYLRNGPRLRNDVYADGHIAGHSEPTLMRAKQDGGIEDRKRAIDGLSEWFLPVDFETHESVDSVPGAEGTDSTTGSTESTEPCWYTPKPVMDAIHATFGPCALDPASPPQPVHVQADKWFAKGLDGLAQSWQIPDDRFLFLNPPWNPEAPGERRPLRRWIDKLRHEMSIGHVRRAIVLIPRKRSDAFDNLLADGAAILNLGRLKFGGSTHESRDDIACLLLGFEKAEVDALLAAFLRHGVERAQIDRYGPLK